MRPLLLLSVIIIGFGCGGDPVPVPRAGADGALTGPARGVFAVPDAPDRPYLLRLPEGEGPHPVLVVLHPSNGRFEFMEQQTCPRGDTNDPGCLIARAAAEGFIVVVPSGTGAIVLDELRTWNGGGKAPWRCVSGRACQERIDDVSYLDVVLAEVRAAAAVDERRIVVVGLGGGASLAHRLGCDRATTYAAIVGVAGGNQHAASGDCFPARPVPVLHVHGDADLCWPVEGGAPAACAEEDKGELVAAAQGAELWRRMNACADAPVVSEDGGLTRTAFAGCEGDVETELVVVARHGHGWPGGQQWAGEDQIGPITADVSATDLTLSFLSRQLLPEALVRSAP